MTEIELFFDFWWDIWISVKQNCGVYLSYVAWINLLVLFMAKHSVLASLKIKEI